MDRDQLRNLSPPDGAVALRSYGRRVRELLAPGGADRDEDDEQGDRSGDRTAGGEPAALPLTAVGPSGWSVAGLLAAATAHLGALDTTLSGALDAATPPQVTGTFSRPVAASAATPAPGPAMASGGAGGPAAVAVVLLPLEAALHHLADRVARTPGGDWDRPLVVDGAPSTAHEVLREAVAYGRTVLDQLAVVVEEARRAH